MGVPEGASLLIQPPSASLKSRLHTRLLGPVWLRCRQPLRRFRCPGHSFNAQCSKRFMPGRLLNTEGNMRNSFEALCTLADRERWCWKIHCGTCGHGDFRHGLFALSSGAHPDSADWIVKRGAGAEIEARLGPMPAFEGWPIRQQRQLQKIIGDADIQGIAEACSFPDGWDTLVSPFTTPRKQSGRSR
jgi:hypothetical protein